MAASSARSMHRPGLIDAAVALPLDNSAPVLSRRFTDVQALVVSVTSVQCLEWDDWPRDDTGGTPPPRRESRK